MLTKSIPRSKHPLSFDEMNMTSNLVYERIQTFEKLKQ